MSDTVQIALKLPAELILRIDAAAGAGKRSGFIRGAIEAALGDGVAAFPGKVVPVAPSVMAKAEAAARIIRDARKGQAEAASGLSSNAQRVFELAGKYPHSERDLIRVLGWPIGEVKAAILELEAAGKLRWSRGMVEAV